LPESPFNGAFYVLTPNSRLTQPSDGVEAEKIPATVCNRPHSVLEGFAMKPCPDLQVITRPVKAHRRVEIEPPSVVSVCGDQRKRISQYPLFS
jgi:hypothetical protein